MKRISLEGGIQNTLRVSNSGFSATIHDSDNVPISVVASGGGLSRIMQHLESNRDFVVITPFRGTRPLSQNVSLFKRLPGKVRTLFNEKKIGGFWLVGHWTECSLVLPEGEMSARCEALGGKLTHSLEYSWLFIRPDSINQAEWERVFASLAVALEQDAYVARRNSKTYVLEGSDSQVWETLTSSSSVEEAMGRLAWLRANRAAYGYTELRKLREKGRLQPIVSGIETASLDVKMHGKYEFSTYLTLPLNHANSMAAQYTGQLFLSDGMTAADVVEEHLALFKN